MSASPSPLTPPVDNSPSTALRTREAQIIDLHQGGFTAARIAKALRMPAGSVRTKISRLRAAGRLADTPPAAPRKDGPSRIAEIVEGIEAEAARRSKIARMDYCDATAALKAEYRARQEAIATKEREELAAIERFRITTIAAVQEQPIPFGDVRSVRRGGSA